MYRVFFSTTGAMAALCLALAGCARTGPTQEVTRADFGDEEIITDFTLGPPGARPGACYGKDVTPATVEQVTEHKLVEEARIGPTGNIIAPAKYETVTEAKIVDGREPIYFETPCPPRWTPEFIASIQRALSARGLYGGPVSGTLDETTRKAIRTFQIGEGLNSAILSTESARLLGLVEIDLS
ncbi:peptidoglycan-binding domain-containing protein [Maritimibacter sp. UBA3975]|uniref:peptidoglycan-binding domain-containing protein n=1 Tax=Maritimibacter sp. UBA3975 TaxID=1946833 RepID=UPI000C09115A|nr:peptidoglycan-binding domain-containing protein [Maritimibacter sp. UBA3975]MAM62577.1 peptidoglycan-binding protein [Maritimibacter sp.]|tara:strand:- start:9303 stop:9851 length:549 start_codon:yes stop_codon:yes gene_type:complete